MAPVRRNVTSLPATSSAASRKEKLAASLATASTMWAAGSSQLVIAKHFGVSRNAVAGWQARNRHLFPLRHSAPAAEPEAAEISLPVETPPAPVAPAPAVAAASEGVAEAGGLPEKIAQAARLWAQGKTMKEIAEAIGVATSTVGGWACKNRDHFPTRDPSSVALAKNARRRLAKGPAVAAGAPPKPAAKPIAVAEKAPSSEVAPGPSAIAGEQVDAAPAVAADDRPARSDAFRPLRGFDPVPLVDASSSACRWPVYPHGRSEAGVAVHCCGRATGSPKLSYCDAHARMSRGAGSSAERAAHKLPRLSSPGSVPVVFASAVMGA